jgi:hypothetical protein
MPQIEEYGDPIFQLDGASPHFGCTVRESLNRTVLGRWTARLGEVPWPRKSPDLIPLDFYFWGFV